MFSSANLWTIEQPLHLSFCPTSGCKHFSNRLIVATSSTSVPLTRQGVVREAAIAIKEGLDVHTLPKKKNFQKKAVAARLAVEIALADQEPASVTALVADLLAQLDPGLRNHVVIAFHDIQTALLASDEFVNEVVSAEDLSSITQSGILLVVGVPDSKAEDALRLVKRWHGSAVVWLVLDTNSILNRPSHSPLFETIFAFEPLAVRGLMRTTEGLIYKHHQKGKSAPWLIYKKSWGDYKLIGKTQARPTAALVETAFYNSSASESPLVQGIKAFKSLTSRKSDQE